MKVYFIRQRGDSFRQSFVKEEPEGRGSILSPSLKIYLTKKDALEDKFTRECDFGDENLRVQSLELEFNCENK